MIGILLLIAGVAGLAIEEQFTGQPTIAIALLILGAIILFIQGVVFVRAGRAFKNAWDNFDRRF